MKLQILVPQYEETDIPIEADGNIVGIEEYAEAGKIMLGEE